MKMTSSQSSWSGNDGCFCRRSASTSPGAYVGEW